MTNTLTWNIKPIALPKINTNLLSTISFFVLCVMLFTAVPFVQTTYAHGAQHAYTAKVEVVKDVYCGGCGVYMGYTVINSYNAIAIHADNDPHRNIRIWAPGHLLSACFACMLEDT